MPSEISSASQFFRKSPRANRAGQGPASRVDTRIKRSCCRPHHICTDPIASAQPVADTIPLSSLNLSDIKRRAVDHDPELLATWLVFQFFRFPTKPFQRYLLSAHSQSSANTERASGETDTPLSSSMLIPRITRLASRTTTIHKRLLLCSRAARGLAATRSPIGSPSPRLTVSVPSHRVFSQSVRNTMPAAKIDGNAIAK